MNVGQLLAEAMKARQCDLLAVLPNLRDAARKNDKRPASVTIQVADDLVKNLRGAKEERDVVLLVRIPRAFIRQLQSPILQPALPPRLPEPPLIVPGR